MPYMTFNYVTLKNMIDMKFLETITEEQIVEYYKHIRFMLRCCRDLLLITKKEWKDLLDYAYSKYTDRLRQAITFHVAYQEMKEGDIDE